jgi:ABC-type oligopeptide transport system ATPase subunit
MDKKKHKKKDNDIINYYEKIPKKYKNNYHNPNYDLHLINLPFRILVIGSSGSGKSNVVINIIQKFNDTFGNVKICCKDKNEPLYRMLSDKLDPSTFQIYEGFKNIPSLDDKEEFDPSLQHLIVFDDLCLEKNQSIIEDYFIRGRKIAKGVNIIYLTQSYFKCPRVVRMNVNYIILKKVGSTKDLTCILREYSLGVDLNQLKNIYKKNVVSMTDFLLIDLDTTDDKRFRKGFNQILKVKNEDSESDEESDNSSSSDEEMKGCGRNKLITLFNKYKK